MNDRQARELLLGSYHAALAAADPLRLMPPRLPPPPRGRTLVVGAGKAAAAMALAVERHWPADAPLSGTVITRYGHGLATSRIRVVEAGHPVPDAAGEQAAASILREARSLGAQDLLLVLVSGGGSSLLALPASGINMADLKAVTRDLLQCGAPIQAINTVRKHLSAIQGGQLAAASSAPVTIPPTSPRVPAPRTQPPTLTPSPSCVVSRFNRLPLSARILSVACAAKSPRHRNPVTRRCARPSTP